MVVVHKTGLFPERNQWKPITVSYSCSYAILEVLLTVEASTIIVGQNALLERILVASMLFTAPRITFFYFSEEWLTLLREIGRGKSKSSKPTAEYGDRPQE